ncbi:ABC transporter ATP-binding protein [Sporomusa acidovorans]|uniref:Vitamin B12 import ATP-binding protein BtuD n=1 Tax=Sporomusa acidovorans (strain ATCC 49682 / DSM 3132 / Mol) TaxID=1123286 RepID=A0ABZ3IYW0_SPOA4|nr:ABC transporter ATP-binding protein [Sporomusa acidovorans]OZC17635.1 hemin import ATP-binding protein HmuV [Sporomusa acidovorans DSM 3132]SDE10227.1 iron complex transport system ATP-binding protein [Sporomusa acidovorans]
MKKAGQVALEVLNIAVALGSKTILHDISFAAKPGEFIGIIGPNGVGKSTLLRSLRGMCAVASGEVRMYGRPILAMSEKELAQHVAYMQQEVNVGFGFTAREVVLTGRYPYLKWWQSEQKQDYAIAQKYMVFTGVDKLAEKPVQQVSGGERQRILLAKVLAQETPLIFLDEPTASLDLVYQEEIFRYCRIMCQEGKTVLIIAHDIKQAAKFCSRLILLADGTVLADGKPQEVITKENLEKAYGLHSAVFINKVTGNLDIHTYEAAGTTTRQRAVHVIGGGGSAGKILRLLYESAYTLSGGVFQQGDTDADIALAFGIAAIVGQPFCEIEKIQAKENREKILAADFTVLCNLCYGQQNFDNLEAAFVARKLIVIEDTPIEERDYTGGKATTVYRNLLKLQQVVVMNSQQFAEQLAAGEGFYPVPD